VVPFRSMLTSLEPMFLPSPEFAKYLDGMMRKDLDIWSSGWFWSLVASTIVVAIGIFCEAPEAWHAVAFGRTTIARIRWFWYVRVRKIDLRGWEQLCPELVTVRSHNERRIAIAGFIGWMLVAFGVAGEGVGEYFVNDAETLLRAFDQAVLIETQNSANSAAAAASLEYFF
jgi:hypothetical protein